MVLIPNTLELTHFWVTQPLAEEIEANPNLVLETDYQPIPFGMDDTLDQESLFPDSVQARRSGRPVSVVA